MFNYFFLFQNRFHCEISHLKNHISRWIGRCRRFSISHLGEKISHHFTPRKKSIKRT